MEFSKGDMKILKGVAILMMMFLHLFCRKEVNGLYVTFLTINEIPVIYYLALFADACVPIYCFASGYALFKISGEKSQNKQNFRRITKLLINYWIILIVFVSIGFIMGNSGQYPGKIEEFFLNFFVLSSSYNGAWWFLQTYIILVIISPMLFKLVIRYSSLHILLISGCVYFFSFLQRFKNLLNIGDETILNMFVTALILVGTSQFPFIIGAIFAKENIYSRLYNKLFQVKNKNVICFVGILLLVLIHSVIETMFIAPFLAIPFICLFTIMNKGKRLERLLKFFGNHSTNIWLTHMFFYMTIFPELTFSPKYPLLIFIWLTILCLITSYIINLIYKPIISIIFNNISIKQKDERVVI